MTTSPTDLKEHDGQAVGGEARPLITVCCRHRRPRCGIYRWRFAARAPAGSRLRSEPCQRMMNLGRAVPAEPWSMAHVCRAALTSPAERRPRWLSNCSIWRSICEEPIAATPAEKSSTAQRFPPCRTRPTPTSFRRASRIFLRWGGECIHSVLHVRKGVGATARFSATTRKCAPSRATRVTRSDSPAY